MAGAKESCRWLLLLLTKTSGYTKKSQQILSYQSLDSSIRPILNSDDISVPVLLLEEESDICESDEYHEHDSNTNFVETSTKKRENFNQAETNDFVRDLSLSKELLELLASGHKEKNML